MGIFAEGELFILLINVGGMIDISFCIDFYSGIHN